MKLLWKDVDKNAKYVCDDCRCSIWGWQLKFWIAEHITGLFAYASCPECGAVGELEEESW